MPSVIQMPKLGHTMTEGTILKWHKSEGDSVEEGEVLLTVETDKAQVEVEAPSAGILARCLAPEGSVIPVGGRLAIIAAPGESWSDTIPSPSRDAIAVPRPALASGDNPGRAGGARRAPASPRARRLAAARGVDLTRLCGTGPGGMITENDVRRAAASSSRSNQQPSVPADTGKPGSSSTAGASSSEIEVPFHREKLTRVQAVGARVLARSWREAPHFVQMVRVDMSAALGAREAAGSEGWRPSINDMILAAAVAALKENPRINSSYRAGELLIYDRINLGIAVDTPEGLTVPVIHGADSMDAQTLSRRARDLAARARDRRLRPEDVEGATFTVSNLGAYGIDNGTPVIPAPQAALMFVGAIREEVLAVAGRIEIRPVMQIAVAFDHRAIDGATAARFTAGVKEVLESRGPTASFGGPPATRLRPREVAVEAIGDELRTRVRVSGTAYTLSAEDDAAPDPVSAFLGSLGSCLLMSLRIAARARGVELGRCSIVARANEKGHVREIDLELKVETGADDQDLSRLIRVAERGCHIRAMIRDDVKVALQLVRQ